MSAGAVYDRVTTLTKAKFGQPINPPLVRDGAATSTAIEDPDHVGITTSILGHTSLRSYQPAQFAAPLQPRQLLVAMRRHQANLLALRHLGQQRLAARSRHNSVPKK